MLMAVISHLGGELMLFILYTYQKQNEDCVNVVLVSFGEITWKTVSAAAILDLLNRYVIKKQTSYWY